MVSRCPSCGSPTPEDEKVCPSCGWDFVARKRTKPGGPRADAPSTPPAPAEPPAGGGFALPPARNLNLPPVGEPTGLKPLPKLDPRGAAGPAEGENPFTLPAARNLSAPEPPPKPAPAPEKPAPPPPKEPPKDGLGARLFRSLRGESKPAEAPASKPEELPPAPDAPEKKGFSLPAARIVESDDAPVERPPEEKPPVIKTPLDDEPPSEPEPPPRPKPKPAPVEPEDEEEPAAPFAEPSARFDGGDQRWTPAPEPLLPTSARDVPPAPSRPEPAAPARKPAAPPATEPASAAAADSRKSMVMIAAIAGGALGTVSVLAVYLLMRPDNSVPASHVAVGSPFGAPGASPAPRPAFPTPPGAAAPSAPAAPVAAAAAAPPVPPPAPVQQSPAPLLASPVPAPAAASKPAAPSGPIVPAPPAAPAPAPVAAPAPDAERPSATFAATPRLVVSGETPKPAAPPRPAAAPAAAAEAPKPRKPKGPRWVFEGTIFDLLTTRGVFGAKLVFVNADGDVVGETDSGPAGRYKISVPPGTGYKLKISHGDYTDRYIDEGDATSSLREATPEERKILMSAAARNLPWTGETSKPVRRDLALVPKTPEEP